MSPISRLPFEVVERIVDDVAAEYDDGLSSIKACALVCHSFLPLCRKHIFDSVTLNPGHPSSTSDNLNHLLSNSPHLAVYIRKLDYKVNQKEFLKNRFSWLLPMFKKLVRLQKLRISYSHYPGEGGYLDWMSPSLRKVLQPLLHFPTLTSIRLDSIRNFALADFAGCVNLENLEIGFLECSNSVGEFLEELPATPAVLEMLAIKGNVRSVQQLFEARRPDGKPIIDFSSLRKITAKVAQLNPIKELFGMCRNLHKVDLLIYRGSTSHLSEYTSRLEGLFTMLKSSLPTLVNIDIEYQIDNDHEAYYGPAGFCHELEKMAGQNVVEIIKLRIWLYQGFISAFNCTRWGELDDVLMRSPEGWPALKEVSLSFHVMETYTGDERMKKTLRGLPMSKLAESKRVQFNFEVKSIVPI